jgi:hypothetical protein
MQRTAIGWVLVSSLGIAALVGCAVGTDPDVGVAELQATPLEAGTDDETSVKLPPSTKPTDEDSGVPDDEEADGGTTGDGGTTTDAGADAGTDAGGGGGAACASPNTCAGSTDLGSLSGDTGAGVKTAQGSGSQWFKVRFTEDDSDVFGTTLLARAELTSPPGTNFDLYMYVAGNGSALECSAVTKSSTTTGNESVSSEWGEGTLSNGSSDDRNVTFEVRWVSGTCSPSAKWTLTVRGN